jgi:hypothetical protein
MCLAEIAERWSKHYPSPEELFNATALAIQHGYCNADLFVKKPGKIIELLGSLFLCPRLRAKYVGWWNEDTGENMWDDIGFNEVVLRYDFGEIYHFKEGIYDPHPGLELGDLSGKRFFKVWKE